MTETQLVLLKIIPSYLTFGFIVIVALVINKKFENFKSVLLKRKKWEEYWADYLLDIVQKYNNRVSIVIVTLCNIQQWKGEDGEYLQKLNNDVVADIHNITLFRWELSIYVDSLNCDGEKMMKVIDRLTRLIEVLLKDKKGNLDEIRGVQKELYVETKALYAKMLSI